MDNYTWIVGVILNALGIGTLFLVAAVITAGIFKRICINPLLNEIMDLRNELTELKKEKQQQADT